MADSDKSAAIQRLLTRIQATDNGDPKDLAQLAHLVHGELHGLARRFMADQPKGHTLQPTALVNEAWLKLSRGRMPQGRAHFLRVAATAMRSILVDHARRRNADKRGGDRARVPLESILAEGRDDFGATLLALHDELERLATRDPGASQVAEMRLFGGMENAEIAAVMDVSPRTVDRLWQTARRGLQREFGFGADQEK